MKLLLLLSVLCLSLTVSAQKKITIDDFTTRNTFEQKSVAGIRWMKDGKFYSSLNENKVIRYDITTGKAVETILDGTALPEKLTISGYAFSSDEKKLLLLTATQSIYRRSFKAEYFVYDLATKSITKLSPNGKQSYAAFSPDGTKVAFVRENNVYYVTLADMKEAQVTTDGKFNAIINGTMDWVYEEEFGIVVGFQWSPDGKRIAYYRFDESGVKEYNLQKWSTTLYPTDYRFKYPKAGEANSTVEIWVHDLATGKKTKADIGTEQDIYVPRISWTIDPTVLSIRKLNRLQNHMEVIHANATTGKSITVLSEKNETYVDVEFLDELTYLDDGKHFIHLSERSGYKHLYLYNINGTLEKQISSGDFEVSEFVGLDDKSKTVYYTSTEISPLEKHLYSISLDGKKKVRLTTAAGNHSINMSRDFQFYIDHHTNSSQPPIATLYKTKGNAQVSVLEKNETLVKTVQEYNIAGKEFFSFKASDGTLLNGFMLKPADFDRSKKYPVLVYQYSGPGSQDVSNTFGGRHFYFHQYLTQNGFIVVAIDPRGTGNRGEAFRKVTYKQLGKYELEDLVSGARYLAGLDFIDGDRMGIWGWSYGGYMSSLAMTKAAGTFKLGIAVAPVTNWRFYDTVYTERFLQTPQLNASGYDDNSPLSYADRLKGKFLLIHGTGDDNVHFQNSVQFQDALIQSGKKFDSFYYPDKNHSIPGAKTKLHLYTMMADYIINNL
jgi:dipeptidyl-peptidase 4